MTAPFILAEKMKSMGKSKFDGLLGLSNDYGVDNIFDLAWKEGKLISPFFGFKLGSSFLKE